MYGTMYSELGIVRLESFCNYYWFIVNYPYYIPNKQTNIHHISLSEFVYPFLYIFIKFKQQTKHMHVEN